jgi:hypothetical protein
MCRNDEDDNQRCNYLQSLLSRPSLLSRSLLRLTHYRKFHPLSLKNEKEGARKFHPLLLKNEKGGAPKKHLNRRQKEFVLTR